MKKHTLWMILGCLLPALLVFILPALGVSGNVTTFIFIALMFACHLFMLGGHGDKDDSHEPDHKHD
jgi:hypothetical protein